MSCFAWYYYLLMFLLFRQVYCYFEKAILHCIFLAWRMSAVSVPLRSVCLYLLQWGCSAGTSGHHSPPCEVYGHGWRRGPPLEPGEPEVERWGLSKKHLSLLLGELRRQRRSVASSMNSPNTPGKSFCSFVWHSETLMSANGRFCFSW